MALKTQNRIRKWSLVVCEFFTLCTLLLMIAVKDWGNLPVCFITLILVLAPVIIERLFSCTINLTGFLFIQIYALGPMLGDCYKLYYVTSWWDKALHTCGGIAFALFGLYLFITMSGRKSRMAACAIFAVCFSVTVSVFWEFFEFGVDCLFGSDMQHDTVITSIESHYLDEELGSVGTLDNIESVVVDGTPLPVKGYLDIGLIDSMTDMLLESLGAVIVGVLYVLDRGRHPVFIPKDEYEPIPAHL